MLLDLYSRRVVGWAMSATMYLAVIDALTMAIEHRQPRPGLIHHTDQGVLYATTAYRTHPRPALHDPEHEPQGRLL